MCHSHFFSVFNIINKNFLLVSVEAEEDSNNKNEFEPNCIEDEEVEEEEDSTDVTKTGIEFSSNLADRISPSLPGKV